jgi:hypothetical protein
VSHDEYLQEPLDLAAWVPEFARIESELESDEIKRLSR